MKNYMVHFRRNTYSPISQEIIMAEQQRMSDLMRENIIQNVFMSKTMDNLWMVFRIDNEEELREIIQTLPMCKDLYFETKELMV